MYKQMFGHYPVNVGKTIGDLVERSTRKNDEGKYGVAANEFTELIDDEDYFDAGVGDGPDPPIEEELRAHVPYCEIQLQPDDTSLKRNVRNTRIKGDLDPKKVKPGDEKDYSKAVTNYNKDAAAVNSLRDGKRTFTVNRAAYNMFRPGYTIVLYGPRRSGKSKLIKNICQRMRHYFPEVVVFTMTKCSGEYFSYIPYCRVIEGLDEELLEKLIEEQMNKKAKLTRGEDVGNFNLLIIIDDCMAEGLRYKKSFNRLFYNGRHSNITLIVAVQDVRGIAPSATINADVVCTFSLPDRRGRDTMREKFCDYLTDDEFDSLYDNPQINKKYHVVMFDIAHRYNPLDKRICFGCVDEGAEEDFVMGDINMWRENNESWKQLEDLGFGYLKNMEDWGIVKVKKQKQKK